MNTKLFLDVDGVVNHFPRSVKTEFPLLSEECMGYEIQYHRPIWDRLAELPVDIHWLTTWNSHANEYIGPLLGWGELPVIGEEEYEKNRITWSSKPLYWWKLQAMIKLKLNEPFIWIDDELEGFRVENWWDDMFDPHLLINPRGSLSNADVDRIEEFLASL